MKTVTFSSAGGTSRMRKLPEDATFADVANILSGKYGGTYKFKFLIDDTRMEPHDHVPEGAYVTVLRANVEAKVEAKDVANQLTRGRWPLYKWYRIHGLPARFDGINKDDNLVFLFDQGYSAQRAMAIAGTLGESGDDCHDYVKKPVCPLEVHEILFSHSEVCPQCRDGRRFRLASKGCIHGKCGRCCHKIPLSDINNHVMPLACPRHDANARRQQLKLRQFCKCWYCVQIPELRKS